jgi:hypothetical protein
MYRIDSVLLVLALLPLVMAVLVRGFVIGRRKAKMQKTLDRAVAAKSQGAAADDKESQADETIRQGNTSVQNDLGSLYGVRFFLPAIVLSFLYIIAFSMGLSCLSNKGPCAGFLCWPFNCFEPKYLYNPVFAAIGAYTFHTGVIVRRSFMSDITKNVYWSSINRLLFSVAFSIALYASFGDGHTVMVVSFAVAFFPSLFITWLRKAARQQLGLNQPQIPELEIQLIQGVDIWKEDRLVEEGIESVQNLATANVFTLAAKMHYPMRTIVDWMDQAILIQRFPNQLQQILTAGLPMSAIEFAWMGLNDADGAKATLIGTKLGLDPIIVKEAMDSFGQDVVVRVLWRLWQTADTE